MAAPGSAENAEANHGSEGHGLNRRNFAEKSV